MAPTPGPDLLIYLSVPLTGAGLLQRVRWGPADAMNAVPICAPGKDLGRVQMGSGGRDEYGPYLGSLFAQHAKT